MNIIENLQETVSKISNWSPGKLTGTWGENLYGIGRSLLYEDQARKKTSAQRIFAKQVGQPPLETFFKNS